MYYIFKQNKVFMSMSKRTIKVTKYRCSSCLKNYESKIFYERHRISCELISRTTKERNLDLERQQDIPNNEQMFELIKTLLLEQSKMKKEIEKLKRFNNTQTKKIDVFEYLNNKIKPIQTYSQWIKSLKFTNDDLDILLEESYLSSMNKYFENLFGNIDEEDTKLPIRAFTEKQNILYIYDVDNDDNNKIKEDDDEEHDKQPKLKWIKLNDDHWKVLMKQVSKLVFDKFKEWQDKNEDRFDEESFSLKYHMNVKKIMSNIGLPMTSLQKKIWNLIKLDFKNIVTYEME